MVTFDAELYLRLLGERLLQDRDQQRRHHRSPLDGPAAALVAAGTIAPGLAWRVIDDYAAAARVRAGERGFPHFGPPARRRQPGHLTPRNTMVLDCEIAFCGGQLLLRDLTCGEKEGTLRFRWRRDLPGASRGHSRMFGAGPGTFPWGSTAPSVVDDRGNRVTVGSGSGGGSDDQWDGKLELRGTLAPDTAWLEVDGTRIHLGRRTAPWEVRIETLDDQDPVERLLWRRLAVAEMPFGHTPDLEPAIEALTAAGSLSGDDRRVREVRAVAARMPDHRRPHRSGGGGSRGLPEPWRSLLRRVGKSDGPTRTIVVGALTPQFDGVQFAAHSVTSESQGFDVEFEIAPNVLHTTALDELPVAWWAHDDRGNHYLGSPNGWGGSDEHAEGTLRFWPALDPRATLLELAACADAHQALVSISLAENPGADE
jgi:hypothetical protein